MMTIETATQLLNRVVLMHPKHGDQGYGKNWSRGRLKDVKPDGKTAVIRPLNRHRKDEEIPLEDIKPWTGDIPKGFVPVERKIPAKATTQEVVAIVNGSPQVTEVTVSNQEQVIVDYPEKVGFEGLQPEDIEYVTDIGKCCEIAEWVNEELGLLEDRRVQLMEMQGLTRDKIEAIFNRMSEALRNMRGTSVRNSTEVTKRFYHGHGVLRDRIKEETKIGHEYAPSRVTDLLLARPEYQDKAASEGTAKKNFMMRVAKTMKDMTDCFEKVAHGSYKRIA